MTKKELHQKNPNNSFIKSYSEAVKKGSKIQQVIPRSDGWAVKRITSDKASGVFPSKVLAVSSACEIARNQKTEVIVHNKDGRISKRISYGAK